MSLVPGLIVQQSSSFSQSFSFSTHSWPRGLWRQ